MDEFQIIDGVRRAKAAELQGHTTILAEVLSAQGTLESTTRVPIGALRSPKHFIQRSHAEMSIAGNARSVEHSSSTFHFPRS
jgi:hypothetical protein